MTVDMDTVNGLQYPARALVDTCVLLNIALGQYDSGVERLPRSKALIDDAIAGKLELLLPAISLIELSTDHILRAGRNVSKSEFVKMKRLVMDWCMNCGLPIAELTKGAAEWFNENTCVQSIRTADACILSTAHYVGATVVYTWDKEFLKKVNIANASNNTGIKAMEPPLRPITLQYG